MMKPRLTLSNLAQLWETFHLGYALLEIGDGITILISERAGRIFGPFLCEDAESVSWINPLLEEQGTFNDFLERGDWNLGGDRVWIYPEVQYFCRDRNHPAQNSFVPASMDPGQFQLMKDPEDGWTLQNRLVLQAYNMASGEKILNFKNSIRSIPNPLHAMAETGLLDGVRYGGYEQLCFVSESTHDDIMSGLWSLFQVRPGGQAIIPVTHPPDLIQYELPGVADEYLQIYPDHVALSITADHTYKVGFLASQITGRFGYYQQVGEEQVYLVIRSFLNTPSSVYCDEPFQQPGCWGASTFAYNDSGANGSYGEIECLGEAIGGSTRRSSSKDGFLLWFYAGPPKQIKAIAKTLLGVVLR